LRAFAVRRIENSRQIASHGARKIPINFARSENHCGDNVVIRSCFGSVHTSLPPQTIRTHHRTQCLAQFSSQTHSPLRGKWAEPQLAAMSTSRRDRSYKPVVEEAIGDDTTGCHRRNRASTLEALQRVCAANPAGSIDRKAPHINRAYRSVQRPANRSIPLRGNSFSTRFEPFHDRTQILDLSRFLRPHILAAANNTYSPSYPTPVAILEPNSVALWETT
jgi:hypothetical protein